MLFEIQEKNDQPVFKINGNMTIYEVKGLHKKIVEYFDNYSELILDLETVQDCDASGIQLIYSIKKTSKIMKKNFSIVNPSETVIEAVARLGMHPEKLLGV